MKKILIIGASGQVGSELREALALAYGEEQVLASDIRPLSDDMTYPYRQLDATDGAAVRSVLQEEQVEDVYLMAAMLSATAEKNPHRAWQLNMDSLLIILEAARKGLVKRVFWPSSIAVFGPDSPKNKCPQQTIQEPSTVYGISKSAGELWCDYYFDRYGVDVRSIRYPGLIGSKSQPGGGTTDYAVHIFYEALEKGHYACFLSPDRALPMMHMEDAIRATLEIMSAPSNQIKVRTSYNIAGSSFSPAELAQCIQARLPEFQMTYAIDSRDEIARSWPNSMDDSAAAKDWGWNARFDMAMLVDEMLSNVKIPNPM